MPILYLAHRIPYPPNKGDKIRSFNEIKHLSRNNELHLACLCDDPADLKYQNDLKRYCRSVHVQLLHPMRNKALSLIHLIGRQPLTIPYFYQKALQRKVDKLLGEHAFDAIFCFSSPMAEYVFRSPNGAHRSTTTRRSPRLIMDFCDVDSDKWRQYTVSTRFPLSTIYRREARTLLEYEQHVNTRFDVSLFASAQEAALFHDRFPRAKGIEVIGNGVDTDYFRPQQEFPNRAAPENGSSPLPPGPNLVFTGAMDYHANVDGALWFATDIFPQIQNRYPSAQFWIVGSKPAPKIRKLAEQESIHVTGFVPDIRPYHAVANVAVIPLRLARGIQNKVLEAMAMGKAVVTTSPAIQGIHARPGEHLLAADNPNEFAASVQRILDDPTLARTLGSQARAFALQHHTWDQHMSKLDQLLTHPLRSSSST